MKILLFLINYFIGFSKYIHKENVLTNELKNELYSYFYSIISILLQPKFFELPLNNNETLLNYIYKDESIKKKSKAKANKINENEKDLITMETHELNKLKILNEQEISENIMIISLIIRVFTSIAYIFMDKSFYDKYLITLLYPLLDKLSLSSIELIHQTSLASLTHISFINNYNSLDDLIIHNCDYLIDSISHNLHYSISSSYFNDNQIKHRLIGQSSRTPQILNALLLHVQSPNIVIPLLRDTIEHILQSLDLLSRNTPSIVEHKTPNVSLLDNNILNNNDNNNILKLNWKPNSNLVYNTQNNQNALSITKSSSLFSLIPTEFTSNKNQFVTQNDYDYIKNKLKQTWQLQCIHQYMLVLHSIVNALVIKNQKNPIFLSFVS